MENIIRNFLFPYDEFSWDKPSLRNRNLVNSMALRGECDDEYYLKVIQKKAKQNPLDNFQTPLEKKGPIQV